MSHDLHVSKFLVATLIDCTHFQIQLFFRIIWKEKRHIYDFKCNFQQTYNFNDTYMKHNTVNRWQYWYSFKLYLLAVVQSCRSEPCCRPLTHHQCFQCKLMRKKDIWQCSTTECNLHSVVEKGIKGHLWGCLWVRLWPCGIQYERLGVLEVSYLSCNIKTEGETTYYSLSKFQKVQVKKHLVWFDLLYILLKRCWGRIQSFIKKAWRV